ncbi:MAG: chorismate synthase [bacterium]|nr:chorismate synthase [bacterium]
MKFRFLSAGESHGKKLTAIIENVPSGFDIDVEAINSELARRQQGYGRGARMQIESDRAEITSGLRFGKTIGSPIAIEVQNKDHERWLEAMSITPLDNLEEVDLKTITRLRPGHADYAGAVKYNQDDVRNILERSSARETAIRVAVGAIAKQILNKFGINIVSKVISIGSVKAEDLSGACQNDLNCPDDKAYELMKKEIDAAAERGVTLGGSIRIEISDVPVGLGSHVHWDRKLDGRLAQALMSIQAVKAVEIGIGKQSAELSGEKVHDEIFYEDEKFIRKTNNAGGIEGGISNGENIIAVISMKPIPTMRTPLKSVDLSDKSQQEAHFERSDTCAVPACGVVAEGMSAIIILQEFLEKFGGDSFAEISSNYQNYLAMRK